ncbi:unnamed protein product [Acanthoscelides obtectus]|uniref:Uncharacterized protein n=1 Tax=Acanthoscelides obtectus TaxID=200917 RepID=A0A9P0LSX1_ACAOB|nr:unnamed protein product [Acanthoscelides obtectus]CAK1630246.1 hypothetical protein AOBTE_LOCUS6225 [Acanthoscelides obtectus]
MSLFGQRFLNLFRLLPTLRINYFLAPPEIVQDALSEVGGSFCDWKLKSGGVVAPSAGSAPFASDNKCPFVNFNERDKFKPLLFLFIFHDSTGEFLDNADVV